MSDVVIRKMRATDIEGAMLVLGAWDMAPRAASPDSPDPERSTLDIRNSFVALDGGRLVGVASYLELSPEEAETASLAVDPRYQGKGVGAMLKRARLQEMIDKGYKRVRTETDRPRTIQWYIRKFGYKKTGTNKKKHEFSLKDVDTWTVLELDLKEYAKGQADN